MTLPLATYTAEEGLAWHYDRSAIDFADLDKCRRLLGPLPDFDGGDAGHEGIATIDHRIYIIRCSKAPAWDFRGRDALYITVTWLPREMAEHVDFEVILASDGFRGQTHNYKYSFDVACEGSDAKSLVAQHLAQESDRCSISFRRAIGEKTFIISKGGANMTEAERFLEKRDEAPCDVENHDTRIPSPEKYKFSTGARILGVILFVLLVLLGTWLAKIEGHVLLGYIAGFAGFGLIRILWYVRK